MIKDSFGRIHDYLRISLIDKCNFSCVYCLPVRKHNFLLHSKLMQREEIFEIAKIFVEMGVKKIRLTGGEPLIRTDIREILSDLSKLPVELAITTNGYFLDKFIDDFLKYGIKSVNVSLDTLDKNKFESITGKNGFDKVYNNIQLLLENHLHPKINIVLVDGINDDEIIRFIEWTKDINVHVRFIEYMPFDSNGWQISKTVTLKDILSKLEENNFKYHKLKDSKHSTSQSYQIDGYKGTFAVISTVSHPFCSTCNRMRLTADGKLRNCLFAQTETDILSAYRKGEDIRSLIYQCIGAKFYERGGLPDFTNDQQLKDKLSKRKMIEIGG